MIKKKYKKYKKYNKWKTGTIVLSIFVIVLVSYSLILAISTKENQDQLESRRICNSIQYTPAWIDSNGEIVNYGYIKKPENATGDIIKELLIPEKIKFAYNPGCSACQRQINDFGDSWEEYQKSGLTINCK